MHIAASLVRFKIAMFFAFFEFNSLSPDPDDVLSQPVPAAIRDPTSGCPWTDVVDGRCHDAP